MPHLQCITVLLAGYETTANALSFAIYLLSAHPEKEAKLLAEVDGFSDDDVTLSYDDLQRMPYMDAVFKAGRLSAVIGFCCRTVFMITCQYLVF